MHFFRMQKNEKFCKLEEKNMQVVQLKIKHLFIKSKHTQLFEYFSQKKRNW